MNLIWAYGSFEMKVNFACLFAWCEFSFLVLLTLSLKYWKICICLVPQCGKPMVVSRCPDCGIQIGGIQHVPVHGFTRHTLKYKPIHQSAFSQCFLSSFVDINLCSSCVSSNGDQTRTGHVLGEADQRSEAPERQLTYVQSSILRLLTHLAMLQGAIRDQRVRWQHLWHIMQISWCNHFFWCLDLL